MRHKWNKDKKTATCRRCLQEVPRYKVKKGGLGPCPGEPLQTTLLCQYHYYGLIAGNVYCWSCGKKFSDEEKKRKATIEKMLDRGETGVLALTEA